MFLFLFLFFIGLALAEIEWEMVGRLGIMGIRGTICIDKGILSRSGKWGIANYKYIKCD